MAIFNAQELNRTQFSETLTLQTKGRFSKKTHFTTYENRSAAVEATTRRKIVNERLLATGEMVLGFTFQLGGIGGILSAAAGFLPGVLIGIGSTVGGTELFIEGARRYGEANLLAAQGRYLRRTK